MIRICHLQLFPLMAGVQRSMLEIFRHLDRSRYEIHVACRGPGPLTRALADLSIPVHYVPSLDRPLRPWRDWQALTELTELFQHQAFQIVHTHSSKPGFLGRLAARRAGVPIVIHHVRGFAFHEFSSPSRHWFYRRLERLAARHCDCLLFVNREERRWVLSRGWLPATRCHTVFNGVDLSRVHPAHRPQLRSEHRLQHGAGESEFVILFVGRLEYPKQPMLIPQIAAELQRLRPDSPWRLWVAGAGPEEARLAECLRQQSLDHRVKLLGWQQDPESLLHAADAVLLPSLHEGLPRALIEAQAAGLPVVASAAKGNREVVAGGTGYLCPAKDAVAYARALAKLVDSPALCRSLGRAARRHAEANFDTAANNQQIVDVYESLLAA